MNTSLAPEKARQYRGRMESVGVRLWLSKSGGLEVASPKPLKPQVLEELRAYKPALVELLLLEVDREASAQVLAPGERHEVEPGVWIEGNVMVFGDVRAPQVPAGPQLAEVGDKREPASTCEPANLVSAEREAERAYLLTVFPQATVTSSGVFSIDLGRGRGPQFYSHLGALDLAATTSGKLQVLAASPSSNICSPVPHDRAAQDRHGRERVRIFAAFPDARSVARDRWRLDTVCYTHSEMVERADASLSALLAELVEAVRHDPRFQGPPAEGAAVLDLDGLAAIIRQAAHTQQDVERARIASVFPQARMTASGVLKIDMGDGCGAQFYNRAEALLLAAQVTGTTSNGWPLNTAGSIATNDTQIPNEVNL